MSGPVGRLLAWRPPTPELPDYLARLVRPDDPEWFAREMAIAGRRGVSDPADRDAATAPRRHVE